MRKRTRSSAICILALFLALAATAAAQSILFEGARLIYDARKPPIENSALLIDKGRVVKIGKMGEVKTPAGTTRVDAAGKTIIPALVDAHIHIGYQKGLSYSAANYTHDNLSDQLQRYTYAGVGAVMSLGTDPGELPLQHRAEQERRGGTLFLFAGRGIAAPNAGPGDVALKPSAWAVNTPEQARNAVREEVAKKVAFIKVWVDDRNGTVKKTTPEIYKAVIDEAHKHGTRAIAHVYYLDDAKDLARSGIDGFAHLVRDKEMDDEIIGLIKEHNIWVMPNLGIAANRAQPQPPAWLDEPLYRETTPAAIIDRVRASYANRSEQALAASQKTYALMQRNLAKLNAAGAHIILGADSGAVPDHFHAFNSHHELQLMVESGLTPAQALTAGTASSSEFLRLKDHGTLDPGKVADLIVLDANPLEDISNTRRIASVYLRGRKIDREGLRKGFD